MNLFLSSVGGYLLAWECRENHMFDVYEYPRTHATVSFVTYEVKEQHTTKFLKQQPWYCVWMSDIANDFRIRVIHWYYYKNS